MAYMINMSIFIFEEGISKNRLGLESILAVTTMKMRLESENQITMTIRKLLSGNVSYKYMLGSSTLTV